MTNIIIVKIPTNGGIIKNIWIILQFSQLENVMSNCSCYLVGFKVGFTYSNLRKLTTTLTLKIIPLLKTKGPEVSVSCLMVSGNLFGRGVLRR